MVQLFEMIIIFGCNIKIKRHFENLHYSGITHEWLQIANIASAEESVIKILLLYKILVIP